MNLLASLSHNGGFLVNLLTSFLVLRHSNDILGWGTLLRFRSLNSLPDALGHGLICWWLLLVLECLSLGVVIAVHLLGLMGSHAGTTLHISVVCCEHLLYLGLQLSLRAYLLLVGVRDKSFLLFDLLSFIKFSGVLKFLHAHSGQLGITDRLLLK